MIKESLMTLDELLSSVHGKLIGNPKECFFTNVATDSREVVENTLFVPLVGEFQDGHKYVPNAIKSGASVILINLSEYKKNSFLYDDLVNENPKVVIICVENTLHGLQDAAEGYVEKFPNLTKISITGSSGKTTTKEMLVSVAKAHFGDSVVFTKGNLNSETGLPLSVFQIRKNHKIGIFEMGMNRIGEIGEISKVLKSQFGIITNIGTAHIGILGSKKNIAQEKRKSFNYIPENGAVFVPCDDEFADFCTENVKGKIVKFPSKNDGVKFLKDNGLFGTDFLLDGIEINLHLSGNYNYKNALSVIACAKELGISTEEIKSGLENVCSVNGRMEICKLDFPNKKDIMLIKDCYNANPDSMKNAIDFCSNLKNVGKRIYILADMKELGESSVLAHQEIGKKIKESNFDFVYLVGNEIEEAYKILSEYKNVKWFQEKTNEVFEKIASEVNKNLSNFDVILLKGSHSMELEKLVPLIEKEGKGKN